MNCLPRTAAVLAFAFAAAAAPAFGMNDTKPPLYTSLAPALDESELKDRDGFIQLQDHQFRAVYSDTTRACAPNGNEFIASLKTEVLLLPQIDKASAREFSAWQKDSHIALNNRIKKQLAKAQNAGGIFQTFSPLNGIPPEIKNVGPRQRWNIREEAMGFVQNLIDGSFFLKYALLAGKGDAHIAKALPGLSQHLSYKFGTMVRVTLAVPTVQALEQKCDVFGPPHGQTAQIQTLVPW